MLLRNLKSEQGVTLLESYRKLTRVNNGLQDFIYNDITLHCFAGESTYLANMGSIMQNFSKGS